MFDFLRSEEGKMRRNAMQWLETAERVHDYRRDQLSEAQALKLQTATGEVRAGVKQRAGVPALTKAIANLDAVMREVGGRIYPANSLVENVDFFLVAAIVILGMRAYFIQPFKIPTNSMWPTYYGMTSEVFKPGQEPGLPARAVRLVTQGAMNHTLKAPADGEVMIPYFTNGLAAFSERPGRTMLVFPAMLNDYVISVGGQAVRLTVPTDWARSPDFGYESVITKAFFDGSGARLAQSLRAAISARRSGTLRVTVGGKEQDAGVYWLSTGRIVKQGEPILSFDILTGDMLFVDRITYNFFPPKVGQGFVFHTRKIEGIGSDQYYVKRLVGLPDDVMEVRRPENPVSDGEPPRMGGPDGQLYRNGRPIDGADAFVKNANKIGLYPGYTANGRLSFGETLTVPKNSYFPMGDNSPSSSDGRIWGFVPEKEVVGRPLVIYYPLTRRWGLAK